MRETILITYLKDPPAEFFLFRGNPHAINPYLKVAFFVATRHKLPGFILIFCPSKIRDILSFEFNNLVFNELDIGVSRTKCLNEIKLNGEYILTGLKPFFLNICLMVSMLYR